MSSCVYYESPSCKGNHVDVIRPIFRLPFLAGLALRGCTRDLVMRFYSEPSCMTQHESIISAIVKVDRLLDLCTHRVRPLHEL